VRRQATAKLQLAPFFSLRHVFFKNELFAVFCRILTLSRPFFVPAFWYFIPGAVRDDKKTALRSRPEF
jgi:hypothetical protein